MIDQTQKNKMIFVGLSGYSYPHTRVRCFHFARELAKYSDVETDVLSFRDHLAPNRSEVDMFDHLRDREKMALVFKAIKRLYKEDPSAVYYVQKAHYHSAAPYLLHRLLGRKYIFDYDDYDVELSVFFGRGTWNRIFFGTRDWLKITQRMAERATACVASSHFLVDFLKQYNPRTYLVQTGVDVDQFTPAQKAREDDSTVFLWTGLIWGEEVYQSVLTILKAFGKVSSVEPKAVLRIVGGGQRMVDVEQLVAKEYSGLNIEFLGWKDPKEMPDILSRCDVGLLPFAENTRWFQSKSPTKLFEYMASGLAVVASDIGEITHVIDHEKNGLLATDSDGFAEAMIELVENRARRQALGAAARNKAVNEYSLPKLGEKLHLMLEELKRDGSL